MHRDQAGKTGKHRADGAVAFRSVPVDQIRLDFAQLFSRGPDTTLIERAQPAGFGDVQAVKPDIIRQFFQRPHRLLGAGNNVDLQAGQRGKATKQGFRRRAKIRRGIRVILKMLAAVSGENGNFHSGDFLKDPVVADLQDFTEAGAVNLMRQP